MNSIRFDLLFICFVAANMMDGGFMLLPGLHLIRAACFNSFKEEEKDYDDD